MTAGIAEAVREGREPTEAEAREFIADLIQSTLGMSLEDFMKRAESGDLPDHPAVPHLVLLAGAHATAC